jgi:hypothetical protein
MLNDLETGPAGFIAFPAESLSYQRYLTPQFPRVLGTNSN